MRTRIPRTSAQQRLAAFAAARPHAWFHDDVLQAARTSFLDTLAVSFAGQQEPVIEQMRAVLETMRSKSGAAGWLCGHRYVPEAAAMLNAVSAHALDYDDVAPSWRGHPGAVLWPALWACASLTRATFADLLGSFAVGFEVGARIGRALIGPHYAAGWHSTATIGAIAATGACSALLRLDAERTSHALGLAVAQAAGVQANFGSDAKPLQAGFAAAAAVRATLYARNGVRASPQALDGPNGFSDLYAGMQHLDIGELDEKAVPELVASGIEIKLYPICYASHRAVAAAVALWPQAPSMLGRVARIRIEGTPGAHQPLLTRWPSTPEEARFSIEYAVACALLTGAVRLRDLSSDRLAGSDVRRLMTMSEVAESNFGTEGARMARVTLVLDDGRQIERSVGSLSSGERVGRLEEKVADCLAEAGVGDGAPALRDALLHGAADVSLDVIETALERLRGRARIAPDTGNA
jgi:2-methylcitrate dehydratase PrpD